MNETPPPAVEIAARWRLLEQPFGARRYDGERPDAPTERRLSEPAPGVIEVAGTTRPGLVVTAPHATNHQRAGEVKWADRGTGGLALLLAELTGCGALVAVGALTDDPGDANFDERHPFKDRLADLSPDVVVDLHGMRTREGYDVDLGFGDGAIPERFLAALDETDLRFTRNGVFDAMRTTTVAAFAQERGIQAVQVEIGAHLRPPTMHDDDGARLVMTLAAAITAQTTSARHPDTAPRPATADLDPGTDPHPETAPPPGTERPPAPASEASTVPAPPRLPHDTSSPPPGPPSSALTGTHHLATTLVPVPSGFPTAVLHPDLLSGTSGPVPVTVTASGRTAVAWAWTTAADGMPRRARELGADRVGVTRRLVTQLGGGTPPSHVDVTVPPHERLRIVSALADDMPAQHEVQVSPRDIGERASYLLVRAGVTAWVTAVPREHVRPGTLRLGYQHRLLTTSGPRADDSAEHALLVAAPRSMIADTRRGSWPRRLVDTTDRALENLWRRLFRAPEFSARVVQAHAGDDSASIIALHPAAFERLGVPSGNQVLVRWGGREAVAQAVEDHDPPSSDPRATVSKSEQRVNRLWPDPPADLSSQTIVRMSAHLRAQLGAPTSTVVSVRRRLRTVLTANLNRLVIPVAGFGLAIHQINDPRWPVIGVAAVLMAVFALARLRMPRPSGRAHVDRSWVQRMAAPPTSSTPSAHVEPEKTGDMMRQ